MVDVMALHTSLVKFVLEVHSGRLDYLDSVLVCAKRSFATLPCSAI